MKRCAMRRGYWWKEVSVAAIGLVIGAGMNSLSAQDEGKRNIEQYLCKDVMRESGTNRDVAIAFLHGYLLGKSGTSSFDLQMLRRQTDEFIENCLDHPGDKAIDVMAKLKS